MNIRSFLPWAGRSAVGEKKAASGFLSLAAQGQASWTGRSYAALSREGFMKNPVAHRCVRLVSEAAACVPFLIYEGERERPEHPAAELLRQPNGRMGGPDFFEALYGHLLLSGNAYIEPLMVGAALRELHLLRPDRISVVDGRDGWPEAYDYRAGGSVRRFAVEAEGMALLQLKLFHPLDDHLGFPPLAAAQVALDLSNAAATWNKALLDNSARPSGALVYQPKAIFRPINMSGCARSWTTVIPGRCAPGGRFSSKAGWTGRRWDCRRKTWISSRRVMARPATSRSPSACRRCCLVFPGTILLPTIRRPTGPSIA
jgi:phage portal protein BeeE